MQSSLDHDELRECHRLLDEAGLGTAHESSPVDCSEDEELVDSKTIDSAIASRLCVSHLLSTWNSRLCEFGSVLFLASIYLDTLMPVSIYALFRAVIAILFSPAIGLWIDQGDRLLVVRASIIGERLAIAISCFILFVLTQREDANSGLSQGLFVSIVLLAGVEKLFR